MSPSLSSLILSWFLFILAYQQQPSNPGASYSEGGEVSEYSEYQQYIQPVVGDDQTPVYTSDGQYEEPYDPYLNYPDYRETTAGHYLEDEDRYQTNYQNYAADYTAVPVIQSRADTVAPVQTSRLQSWMNQLSEMVQNFLQRLEEKSRSSNPDRLLTMFTVASLIIGSILSL